MPSATAAADAIGVLLLGNAIGVSLAPTYWSMGPEYIETMAPVFGSSLRGAMMSGRGRNIIDTKKQYKMEWKESSVVPGV